MKKYLTYTRKNINDNYYQDPNTNNIVEEATGGITKITETGYELNGVFLAHVEFPTDTPDEQIEYFRTLDEAFNFTFITEEEANIHLTQIGDITVKDFVFTDNRPEDII